jgi:chromosome segregation ATPase
MVIKMAGSGKRFKTAAVGGFNRQDVITYLEALLKEHSEETEAHRAGAELLRRERDEARNQIAALRKQAEASGEQLGQLPRLHGRVDELSAQTEELLREKLALTEGLRAARETQEGSRAELARLYGTLAEKDVRLSAAQTRLDELDAARVCAADIESRARQRAGEIERAACENAQLARETAARQLREAREGFAALRAQVDEASRAAVSELDRARTLLTGAGLLLDGAEEQLAVLAPDETPAVPAPFAPAAPASAEPPAGGRTFLPPDITADAFDPLSAPGVEPFAATPFDGLTERQAQRFTR